MTPPDGESAVAVTPGEAGRNAAMQAGLDSGTQPETAQPETAERPPPEFLALPGRDYLEGPGLLLPAEFRRYARKPDDPLYRPLRVYETDPVTSGYNGRVVTLAVAYEPLEPGPKGQVIEVIPRDGTAVALDRIAETLGQGRRPSTSDPLFHQQMVYALASDVVANFAMALGREPAWGFAGPRLKLRPDAIEDANAYYDSANGEIVFGYFTAGQDPGAGINPGSTIRTCISRDIVVHEMAHAMLDGMRARFAVPTNPEVGAFHEGFADLVAILQRFSIRESVELVIRESRGRLKDVALLTDFGQQFGMARGMGGPLRAPLAPEVPRLTQASLEVHDRGTVLVAAVLDAFLHVYARRARPILELVMHLPRQAPLPEPAVDLLTDLACRLASHFLSLSIRAIDYCPPVDLHLGEYLRALITADHDLVEDDRYDYRAELIAAFARKAIYPPDVTDLSEDSLLWCQPERPIPAIPGLALSALALPADPGQAPDAEEIRRQAAALADRVTDPAHSDLFGLLPPGEGIGLPSIDSVRVLRRVGPDRQVQVGLVCEVTQDARIPTGDGEVLQGIGGATIILGGSGEIRLVIGKRVGNSTRARLWAQALGGNACAAACRYARRDGGRRSGAALRGGKPRPPA